jgi:hypothetical protein
MAKWILSKNEKAEPPRETGLYSEKRMLSKIFCIAPFRSSPRGGLTLNHHYESLMQTLKKLSLLNRI